MTSPEPSYTRVSLTPRQWIECAIGAVLIVAVVILLCVAVSHLIEGSGSFVLRPGQSTWIPSLDRRGS